MATYAWTRTLQQVVSMVLRKLGVIGATDTGEPEDVTLVIEVIDARLKELHALGVLWWQVSGSQTSITLTSGTVTATIAPSDYLFPVSLVLVDGTEQRHIEIIGHRQYQAIPDKSRTGPPEQVFIDGVTCRFYPVPVLNGAAQLTYQAIAADAEMGVAVDVPVSMIRALVAVIAADLVDEFDIQPAKAQRLMAMQPMALRTIRMLTQQRVDTATVEAEYF